MIALPRARAFLQYLGAAVFCLLIVNVVLFTTTRTRSHPRKGPSPSKASTHNQPLVSGVPIPRQIWQIFFAPPEVDIIEEELLHSSEWISMTPDYTYTMVGSLEADEFIDANFKNQPEIPKTYHALQNPGLKSDFLRYLLLLVRGGIYSDVDTKPVVRPEDWIPVEKRQQVRLIVAIEYDEAQDPHPEDFKYPVQFCQWTIAAAPNHPVLKKMVSRAVTGLQDIANAQATTLDRMEITDFNVLNATGPVAWTEVVLETLQEVASITSYRDLAKVNEAQYYGDIVILPLESFRADYLDDWGVSWRTGRRAFVRHFFKGGWKKKPPP
ncbi:nucleotide-diphospho-sugar transferase [Diplogelasinospora grovesii]|uniref:Nucleotide-diphospho-sugar transferase n=1 Tax=Diplogelasinospora grovesii TaxID=303347 RepID=A0AAN6S0C0_9PEZI|nr:nucleotide-diphospho-sugar transferase [Diplogelasinospora grovesii]